jgi:20S proteasome alpha/beta subunit
MTTVVSFDRDHGVVRTQHSRRSNGTRAAHQTRTEKLLQINNIIYCGVRSDRRIYY